MLLGLVACSESGGGGDPGKRRYRRGWHAAGGGAPRGAWRGRRNRGQRRRLWWHQPWRAAAAVEPVGPQPAAPVGPVPRGPAGREPEAWGVQAPAGPEHGAGGHDGQDASAPERGAGGGEDAGGPRMMYMVSNLDQLRMRVAAAEPGDTHRARGWDLQQPELHRIDRKGTAAQPIVVAAQTIGGVTISGAAGLTFGGNAAYAEIRGFRFTHAAATNLPAGSHHCRLMRNVFNNNVPAGTRFVVVSGDDHEVGYNTFRDKSNEGMFLNISGPGGAAMAQRTWVHHNYFLNFAPCGANNCGAIQIGLSGKSLTDAHAIMEYNLFVNTRGENEGSLTSKVSSCIYRYNTFGAGAEELSLRHGNNVQVYGNFFIGSVGGMRIFGHNHRIYSNYFENNAKAINVGNGDCTIPPGALTCHDKPVGVHITFNTLVNNQRNIFMTGRSGGLGAGNMVIANNIIQGGGMAGDFSGPMAGSHLGGQHHLRHQRRRPAGNRRRWMRGWSRKAACSGCQSTARRWARQWATIPTPGRTWTGRQRADKRAPGADEPASTPSMNRPLTADRRRDRTPVCDRLIGDDHG